MSAPTDGESPQFPPWNWSRLAAPERQAALADLADWVVDLQEAYGRWVRLPPCWPCHRGLRAELAAFWYWRQHLDRSPTAAADEAVRWYQALRLSAQAWAEAYGGCRHESVGEVDERRIEGETVRSATAAYMDTVKEREERSC